jgi:hypothetical protein
MFCKWKSKSGVTPNTKRHMPLTVMERLFLDLYKAAVTEVDVKMMGHQTNQLSQLTIQSQ